MSASETRTIATKCPICAAVLPLFDVTFITSGWWKRSVQILIGGDATDYVAHLWEHEQKRRGEVWQ